MKDKTGLHCQHIHGIKDYKNENSAGIIKKNPNLNYITLECQMNGGIVIIGWAGNFPDI